MGVYGDLKSVLGQELATTELATTLELAAGSGAESLSL